MKQLCINILNEVGLHARPAVQFVKSAAKYQSEIRLRNITRASDWASAKSILEVLTLGVEQKHEIEITFSGVDEEEAAREIENLIRGNFVPSG